MSESNTGLYWLLGLCLAALLVLNTAYFTSNHSGASASDVQAAVSAGVATIKVPTPTVDTSALQAQLDNVSKQVGKDDAWKGSAESLALSELSRNSYRDLFNFLESNNVSVVEKQDITSVVVDKLHVSSFDTDRQDATIVDELRVRYDGNSGSSRVYVDVTTTVESNEVTDQVYSFH